MSYVTLITGATTTSITLAEAKDHLVESTTVHNTAITDALFDADAFVEKAIRGGGAIRKQTWRYCDRDFPTVTHTGSDILRLPKPPLASVTTVKYYNESNVLTTLSTTEYVVVTPHKLQGWIEPAVDKTWPITTDRPNGIEITMVAGTTGNVPRNIQRAVKMALAFIWENRGDAMAKVDDHVERSIFALASSEDYGFYG